MIGDEDSGFHVMEVCRFVLRLLNNLLVVFVISGKRSLLQLGASPEIIIWTGEILSSPSYPSMESAIIKHHLDICRSNRIISSSFL